MKTDIHSEIRKLISVRSSWALAAGAVAIAVATVLAAAAAGEMPVGDPLHNLLVLRMPLFTGIVLLVLGIRSVTDEFRYGTMAATTALAPMTRIRPGDASTVAAVAEVTVIAGSLALAAGRGETLVLDAARLASVGSGVVVAGAAIAAFGVGLGAVVRHQVPAVVGGILWFLLAEELLSVAAGEASRFLPAALAQGASYAALGAGLSPPAAALGFTVYTAGLLALGSVLMRRRDLS